MQKEKTITLGYYTEEKLKEITNSDKIGLELEYGYRLDEEKLKIGLPKIPVFGLASEHTPEELRADGYIPTQEVIEYWEGKQ